MQDPGIGRAGLIRVHRAAAGGLFGA